MSVGVKAKQVGAPLRRGNAEWFGPGSLRFMGSELERVCFSKNVREMEKGGKPFSWVELRDYLRGLKAQESNSLHSGLILRGA